MKLYIINTSPIHQNRCSSCVIACFHTVVVKAKLKALIKLNHYRIDDMLWESKGKRRRRKYLNILFNILIDIFFFKKSAVWIDRCSLTAEPKPFTCTWSQHRYGPGFCIVSKISVKCSSRNSFKQPVQRYKQ